MLPYAEEVRTSLLEQWPASRFFALGHIGDGNLHFFVTPGAIGDSSAQQLLLVSESLPAFSAALTILDLAALTFSAHCSGIWVDSHSVFFVRPGRSCGDWFRCGPANTSFVGVGMLLTHALARLANACFPID
jgi:hypothetical protein